MSDDEKREYFASIMSKLVDGPLSDTELLDLSSELGLTLRDWYESPPLVSESVAAVEAAEWQEVKLQEAA